MLDGASPLALASSHALGQRPSRRAALRGVGVAMVSMLAGCSSSPGHVAVAAPAFPMVLSIDDGPMLARMPLLTPGQRHEALRAALASESVQAVMFMTLSFGADRPEGLDLARQWSSEGHLLANHTVSHLDLHDPAVTLARYLSEVDACEAFGRQLPNWRLWFRATYLNTGRDEKERQALLRGLAARGYLLAEVDLDSRDWQFAALLQARLQAAPDRDDEGVHALRQRFLRQLDERTGDLARQAREERKADGAGQPDRARVLLVHDHLPMALWLPEVLALMRRHGFAFVAPQHVWSADPDRRLQ
jgi:peptidoglycan-N-acetylglucosamine deacetylase